MKIEFLLEDLESDDPARVEAAAARLAGQADSVVPALLRGLAGVQRTADLEPVIGVLRHTGPPACDAVLAAWGRKEVTDWQAGRLLGVFDERSADQYAALAADPDHSRSGNGFRGYLSVDPDEVGPDTEVRGHGWLALTAPGVGHGAFPGTLRI
ncbi:hypothetical protein ACFY2W_29060 [Streptomyces sp. NPDC001262]|uniref:hypothetical protein n=1 Tax=Streptomyces sp. NPDC001262 TaxID=3364552 RepID=UPI003682929E